MTEQKRDGALQNLWNKQIEPFDIVKRRMEKLNYMLWETFYEGTTDSWENVEVKERLMCQLSHHLFHSFCLFFFLPGVRLLFLHALGALNQPNAQISTTVICLSHVIGPVLFLIRTPCPFAPLPLELSYKW